MGSLMEARRRTLLSSPHSVTIQNADIASFSTDMRSPLRSLRIGIDPVQEGTGDPSPDNVRPISGWTGVNVWRTGANIFGGPALKDGLLYSMPTATHDSANKTVAFSSGQAVAYSNITTGVKFKENTRYTFIITASKNATASTLNLRIYYTDGTYTNLSGLSATETKQTAVTVSTAGKTVSSLGKFNGGGTTTLYYEESGVFEGNLTAADFQPYSGNQYTIQLGQTVYGGTLDVTNGVLTVTMAVATATDAQIDGATECVYQSKAGVQFTLFPENVNRRNGTKSNVSTLEIGAVQKNQYIWAGTSAGNKIVYWVGVLDAMGKTLSEWKTWAKATGIQVGYTLATPITIPLSDITVQTLAGTNVMWADCGEVELLKYWTHK